MGRNRTGPTSSVKTFKARDFDLDLGLGHTAYRCASLIDLYLHVKFHWNQINFFVRTSVRTCTYVRTDVHMRPILLSLLKRVDLTAVITNHSCRYDSVFGRPTAHAPSPLAGSVTYDERRRTPTDVSEQNNTGPLGGPVLIQCNILVWLIQ